MHSKYNSSNPSVPSASNIVMSFVYVCMNVTFLNQAQSQVVPHKNHHLYELQCL